MLGREALLAVLIDNKPVLAVCKDTREQISTDKLTLGEILSDKYEFKYSFSDLPIEDKRKLFREHCEKYGLHIFDIWSHTNYGYQHDNTQFIFSLFCLAMAMKDE